MGKGFLLPLVWLMVSSSPLAQAGSGGVPSVLCGKAAKTDPIVVGSAARRDHALAKIETEGKEACAKMLNKKEQDSCYKVLEVAKAMINGAYDHNASRIACK